MNMATLSNGALSMVTAFTILDNIDGSDVITNVAVALITGAVYAIINIAAKIITSILEKRGLISKESKKAIDDTVNDLADDGKLNNSYHDSNTSADEWREE